MISTRWVPTPEEDPHHRYSTRKRAVSQVARPPPKHQWVGFIANSVFHHPSEARSAETEFVYRVHFACRFPVRGLESGVPATGAASLVERLSRGSERE